MKSTLFGPHPVDTNKWSKINEEHVRPWYWVSREGQVWREPTVMRNGHGRYRRPPQILKTSPQTTGYPQVALRCVPDASVDERAFLIHRPVMIYHGPDKPFDSAVVNHIDGDKTNYSLENLEWVSQAENRLHGLLRKSVHRIGRKATVQKMREWLHHFD